MGPKPVRKSAGKQAKNIEIPKSPTINHPLPPSPSPPKLFMTPLSSSRDVIKRKKIM
jgi:hypothetical protein